MNGALGFTPQVSKSDFVYQRRLDWTVRQLKSKGIVESVELFDPYDSRRMSPRTLDAFCRGLLSAAREYPGMAAGHPIDLGVTSWPDDAEQVATYEYGKITLAAPHPLFHGSPSMTVKELADMAYLAGRHEFAHHGQFRLSEAGWSLVSARLIEVSGLQSIFPEVYLSDERPVKAELGEYAATSHFEMGAEALAKGKGPISAAYKAVMNEIYGQGRLQETQRRNLTVAAARSSRLGLVEVGERTYGATITMKVAPALGIGTGNEIAYLRTAAGTRYRIFQGEATQSSSGEVIKEQDVARSGIALGLPVVYEERGYPRQWDDSAVEEILEINPAFGPPVNIPKAGATDLARITEREIYELRAANNVRRSSCSGRELHIEASGPKMRIEDLSRNPWFKELRVVSDGGEMVAVDRNGRVRSAHGQYIETEMSPEETFRKMRQGSFSFLRGREPLEQRARREGLAHEWKCRQ